ncbi:TPA: hypothetical protein H2S96_003163 [Salmonella enterica]|nr:hypothetical protein [Salmonella enterica]
MCWLFANTSSIPSPFCISPVSLSPSTIELPLAELEEALRDKELQLNIKSGLIDDVTNGKAWTITLPDITSKAFWSSTGKNETFHPETYKRQVKEAIERSCVIAGIGVEVK